MKQIFILGRQPELGVAELESLFGSDKITDFENNLAILDYEGEINFINLGGSIKCATIMEDIENLNINALPSKIENVCLELEKTIPEGKIILGFSFYNIPSDIGSMTKLGIRIKKALSKKDRSIRFIPNKELDLNSASVYHNKLTSEHGIEIIVAKIKNRIIIARTSYVQNIDAYRNRDQERPFRDSKIGMLPPKLAQILINLAKSNNKDPKTVLDPFCGTGVVLQEALLMGLDVIGSDLNPKMVDFSVKNTSWLKEQYPGVKDPTLIKEGDATITKWDNFDLVASESYLGATYSFFPRDEELAKEMSSVNNLLKNFFKNLHEQIDENTGICVAVPAWNNKGNFMTLPLIDQIEDMGYNFINLKHSSAKHLFYSREDQIVVRQLLVIKRK